MPHSPKGSNTSQSRVFPKLTTKSLVQLTTKSHLDGAVVPDSPHGAGELQPGSRRRVEGLGFRV